MTRYTTAAQSTAPPPRNGLGTAGMVLGIIAVVLAFIPILGMVSFLLAPLAVILGAVGWTRARGQQPTASNPVAAAFGVGLGAVAFLIVVLVTMATGAAVEQIDRDLQGIGSGAPPVASGGDNAEQPQVIELGFGESYTWPGGESITVSAPQPFSADNMFNEPEGRFVSMDVTIVNNGTETYQGMQADFTVQHNGRPAQENWMDSDTLPDVQIPPGGQTTITLVYDIGSEPGEITVSAQPNMFAATTVFYGGQV